jgi:hypothetical protein
LEASASKQYINNNINPLYTDILSSGRTKQQLLNAMRKTLWSTECVTKAKRSAYSKLRYDKKGGGKSLILSDGHTLSDAIEEAYVKLLGNTRKNLEWYPDCWITFLYMGRACDDKQVSPMFNGGLLPKDIATIVGPNEVIARVGSKTARKMYYNQINSGVSSTSGSEQSTKRKRSNTKTLDLQKTEDIDHDEKKSLSKLLTLKREKVMIICSQ